MDQQSAGAAMASRASPSGEAQGSVGKVADYAQTISRLERRADGSRQRVKIVGGLLAMGVMVTATAIFWRLQQMPTGDNRLFAVFSSGTVNTEELMAARVREITTRLHGRQLLTNPFLKAPASAPAAEPPNHTPEVEAKLRVELREALDDLERATKIEAQRKPDTATDKIQAITSTAVFSLGAVAFLVLLIQIAVMFIRYHLRLAELYDAQADALRASGGDAQLAYGFLQHFSPNTIELGNSPTTLYEKALDTIKEVAHKK